MENLAIEQNEPEHELDGQPHSPPHLLMSVPKYLSTAVANNVLMEDVARYAPPLDRARAMSQFQSFYRFVSSQTYVHLLPSVEGLQDQVYVSNLGVVMSVDGRDTAVLANFRSEPRRGEEQVGMTFLSALGYPILMAPQFFEGEADFKRICDGVYAGAYGLRTSADALDWLARTCRVKVIACEITNPYLYHLDCLLFQVAPEQTLAVVEAMNQATVRELEKHTNVIPVPMDLALASATNCIRLNQFLLCDDGSNLYTNDIVLYRREQRKLEFLRHVAHQCRLQLRTFDMTEFMKSGAALSCLAMGLPPLPAHGAQDDPRPVTE